MPRMRDQGTMVRAFLSALSGGAPKPEERALEDALTALYDAGRAAWPNVAVDPLTFARHLASIWTEDAALPRVAFGADVYLACACALGDARAIAAFDRAYAGVIARAVARVGPTLGEDAAQLVREKLLVKSGERLPKIAEYAGRAPLGGWLATVAVRTAQNLRRRREDRPGVTRPLEEMGLEAAGDPDLDLLEARYKGELEASVRHGLTLLTTRERTILRLHLEQRMTVDALAAHYGTSRATAGRWLKAARDALAEHARADLSARLGLSPSEIDSVAKLLRSRLDVSVVRLLGEEKTSPG